MRTMIYQCDFCGKECDPDDMLHCKDDDGEQVDVCEACLVELVRNRLRASKTPTEQPKALQTVNKTPEKPKAQETAVTAAEREAIISDRKNGMSILNLAQKHHRGQKTIRAICAEIDEQKRKAKVKVQAEAKRLKVDWSKAQALRDAGWSLQSIADELGVCAETVFNHTHKPEVKISKPHEWIDEDLRRLAGTDENETRVLMGAKSETYTVMMPEGQEVEV